MTILDTIVQRKRIEIAEARQKIAEIELDRRAKNCPTARDFRAALSKPGMRIIAEVKKASPSAGVIRPDFDPVDIAQTYERHGGDCLSVLTDEHFFQGKLSFLTQVHDATSLPVLRKDFILERYQLVESRVAGADAVLLIAEILPGDRLRTLHDEAVELGLHVLVEFHDAEQLTRVVDSGAKLIGINNRDLRTFQTSLEQTLSYASKLPRECTVISESGIRTHTDLVRLESAGVKAVLVGESLIRSVNIGAALDTLRGVDRDVGTSTSK